MCFSSTFVYMPVLIYESKERLSDEGQIIRIPEHVSPESRGAIPLLKRRGGIFCRLEEETVRWEICSICNCQGILVQHKLAYPCLDGTTLLIAKNRNRTNEK